MGQESTQARPCVFQPGKVTGCGNGGVKQDTNNIPTHADVLSGRQSAKTNSTRGGSGQ